MKIVLINPPHYQLYIPIFTRYFPLSLAYLASSAQQEGVEIKIFDSLAYEEDTHFIDSKNKDHMSMISKHPNYKNIIHWGASWDRILEFIKTENPDIVGISCHQASTFYETTIISNLVKSYNKNIKVIVGGGFPTVRPDAVLSVNSIDIIVRAEGEKTIKDIIKTFNNDLDLSKIKGIGFKIHKKHVITPEREFSCPDDLPFPAIELLPLERYYKKTGFRYSCLLTGRGC